MPKRNLKIKINLTPKSEVQKAGKTIVKEPTKKSILNNNKNIKNNLKEKYGKDLEAAFYELCSNGELNLSDFLLFIQILSPGKLEHGFELAMQNCQKFIVYLYFNFDVFQKNNKHYRYCLIHAYLGTDEFFEYILRNIPLDDDLIIYFQKLNSFLNIDFEKKIYFQKNFSILEERKKTN